MATRTLAEAQAELTKAYAARARILDTGQNSAVDGMSVSQANLATINDTIKILEAEVEGLTNAAAASNTAVPFRFALAKFT
jgi:hypothetical protein